MLHLPRVFRFGGPAQCRDGFQGINARPEAVVSHVGRGHRMSRGPRRCPGRLVGNLSSCGMRGNRRFLRIADGNLPFRPSPGNADGALWPLIGTVLLEKRKDMLGTIGGPSGKQAVLFDVQKSAPMNGHKPAISHVNRS
jgi:hypothetical protein